MILEKIQNNELSRVLGTAVAAARQSDVKARQELLLETQAGRLTVVGCGASVEVTVATDINEKSGAEHAFTISASSLADVLSSLPKDLPSTLKLEDATLKITCGRSRFRLRTLPAEDFSRFSATASTQTSQRVALDGRQLVKAIKAVMLAIPANDARYYLNGVLLDLEPGALSVVGTDGHRLHRFKIALEGSNLEQQAIIPREVARDILVRALDQESIALESKGSLVEFQSGASTVRSRVVEGKYPDYKRFFAAEAPAAVTVSRAAFAGMLERAALVHADTKRAPAVKLSVRDGLIEAQASQEGDDFFEEVEAQHELDSSAQAVEAAFNIGYLLDAIKPIAAEQLQLLLPPPNAPVAAWRLAGVGDEAYSAVVMPMRI